MMARTMRHARRHLRELSTPARAVQLRRSASARWSIENSSARGGRAPPARRLSPSSRAAGSSAAASAAASPGGDQLRRPDAGAGHVAVARAARRPRWASRRPSPRAAPRRTTRPAPTGSRTRQPRGGGPTFSSSLSRPSHSIRGSPAHRAWSAAVSGPSLPTHRRTSPGRPAIASSSTARPLRGSWRPQKKMVGPARWATAQPSR